MTFNKGQVSGGCFEQVGQFGGTHLLGEIGEIGEILALRCGLCGGGRCNGSAAARTNRGYLFHFASVDALLC